MVDIDTVRSWQGKTMVDRDGDKVGSIESIYVEEAAARDRELGGGREPESRIGPSQDPFRVFDDPAAQDDGLVEDEGSDDEPGPTGQPRRSNHPRDLDTPSRIDSAFAGQSRATEQRCDGPWFSRVMSPQACAGVACRSTWSSWTCKRLTSSCSILRCRTTARPTASRPMARAPMAPAPRAAAPTAAAPRRAAPSCTAAGCCRRARSPGRVRGRDLRLHMTCFSSSAQQAPGRQVGCQSSFLQQRR
jgi:hypothetical protein